MASISEDYTQSWLLTPMQTIVLRRLSLSFVEWLPLEESFSLFKSFPIQIHY